MGTRGNIPTVIEKLVHARHKGEGSTTGGAKIQDAIQRRQQGALYTVCNITWSEPGMPDGAQTVVIYEGPWPTQFPRFGTERRTERLAGMVRLMRLLTLGAARDLRVPEDPEFSRTIYVGAWRE